MYQIRHAGAKGLGVFATKLIPRGTRILAEKPLLTVKSERDLFSATRNMTSEDLEFIKGLSVKDQSESTLQDWVRILWDVTRGSWTSAAKTGESRLPTSNAMKEYTAVLAAFRNNNFSIDADTQAVFREISRLNHSCVPNTQGNFNTKLNAFTIHSLRPIEADEEVTVSYIETYGGVHAFRTAALWKGYGFVCVCPACDMKKKRARDGERRRRGLKERLARMHAWQKGGGGRDYGMELELLGEMIGVFETEGLAGRELGTMYLAAAEGYLKLGDHAEARRCAKVGIELEEVCLGTDSPFYQESLRRTKDVEAGSLREELR